MWLRLTLKMGAVVWLAFAVLSLVSLAQQSKVLAQTSQSGSIGIEGKISAPPPTKGATISLPSNGQTFTTGNITVSGLCPNGLLVKIFRNNIFAGSAECKNGSFSIMIDLFNGQNDIVARVYDALDQAGPDSNTVVVQFNDPNRFTALGAALVLTSNYARRGANPGEPLEWPIIVSGGVAPYAVSIDWGDGQTTLQSQEFAETFLVKHTYKAAGVYTIIVKVADKGGSSAFLQLVGVANGPVSGKATGSSGSTGSNNNDSASTARLWQLFGIFAIVFPIIIGSTTFWLGTKHELFTLRKRLENEGR